jgi:hypothetical protein
LLINGFDIILLNGFLTLFHCAPEILMNSSATIDGWQQIYRLAVMHACLADTVEEAKTMTLLPLFTHFIPLQAKA